MSKIGSFLYFLAKLLGDLSAVQKGKIGKRAARSAAGKLSGKGFKKFKKGGLKLIEKRKGSTARKQIDPKRMTEAKRLVHSKGKDSETQQLKLLLGFVEEHSKIDITPHIAETLWTFLRFLKKSCYQIVHDETVFCIPFSHLVKKADLK